VRLFGDLGGEHIDETYAPEFRWRYDPARITPDTALSRSETHNAQATVVVAWRLHVLSLSIRASVARWLALFVGLGVFGCGMAAIAWARTRRNASAGGLADAAPRVVHNAVARR
jgi:hypothetical protein